jgi:HAD superfamily phosphatase (TIGR01681 family)
MYSVAIFDLDDTLICRQNDTLYTDVKNILSYLKDKNITIALASYNSNAIKVLQKHDIYDYFDIIKFENWKDKYLINSYDKKETMLRSILLQTTTTTNDAVFFDDDERYFNTAEKIGLKMCKIGDTGITMNDIKKYFDYTS